MAVPSSTQAPRVAHRFVPVRRNQSSTQATSIRSTKTIACQVAAAATRLAPASANDALVRTRAARASRYRCKQNHGMAKSSRISTKPSVR